jgi:photosystem II stability/assembly factor-like uncharacterized protein
LTPQNSGTSNSLIAVSPVDQRTVWAAGRNGTFTVTRDGGTTWHSGVVPGAEALQFRDVEGITDRVAYLLSIGNGTDSRIYKTEDGGATWQLQFQNDIPAAFYDCFAFWTPQRGFAYSDAVGERFPVIRTSNGRTWENIGTKLPEALPGEAGFASSGTCVTTHGDKRGWIITGGAAKSRVILTTDGGDTWQAFPTPIVQGTAAAGGFSIDFRDATHGILAGGDLEQPDKITQNVAKSKDGGRTWQLVTSTPFVGAVFGLSYVDGERSRGVVATGPAGAAWSPDEGGTWNLLPGVDNYWAVAFANREAGWLVGTGGRILKITF